MTKINDTYEIQPSLAEYDIKSSLHMLMNISVKSFSVPICQIYLINGDCLTLRANEKNIQHKTTHLKEPYLQSITDNRAIILKDVVLEETEDAVFFACAPMVSKTGSPIGGLAIIDHNTQQLTANHIALLEDLALMASKILEKHKVSLQLQNVFTDFIHKAVHDLKNPNTSILLATELLNRKINDQQTIVKLAGSIETSCQKALIKLDKLYTHLLLAHEFGLKIQEIDIDEFLDSLKTEYTQYPLAVSSTCKKVFYADKNRLQQAVINILHHLSAHTPMEKPLYLSAYQAESNLIFEIKNKDISFSLNKAKVADNLSDYLYLAKILAVMHQGIVLKADTDAENGHFYYISIPFPPL